MRQGNERTPVSVRREMREPHLLIEVILAFAIVVFYAIRLRRSVLARLRPSQVRLPVICGEGAVVIVVMLQLLHRDPFRYHGSVALRYVGLVLALLGAAFSSFARLVLNENYVPSAAAHASKRLVVAWPYSMVRHPAYLGNAVAFLGFELAVESGGLLVVLVYTVANVWQANREEAMMAAAHGRAWSDYRKRVRFKLVPWLFAIPLLLGVTVACLIFWRWAALSRPSLSDRLRSSSYGVVLGRTLALRDLKSSASSAICQSTASTTTRPSSPANASVLCTSPSATL